LDSYAMTSVHPVSLDSDSTVTRPARILMIGEKMGYSAEDMNTGGEGVIHGSLEILSSGQMGNGPDVLAIILFWDVRLLGR